ncbi:MAG TPA: ubiquitin-conjugating enzyme E2 [Tepidisphaeraceae bacterium]|jgi:ubiquitin-protein ligase
MISFACDHCQKAFTVPDSYAGRRARCKGCGQDVRVPTVSDVVQPPVAPLRPSLRIRRLIADAELMRRTFANTPRVRIESTEGSPPEVYRIAFNVVGLDRDAKGKPIKRPEHVAEIRLGADYPRLPPVCKMLTTVFHPNIDPASVCIGDHWTAGERLVDLVVRLAEMLAYQAYNIRSPLDGEAAMWADLNPDKLPTDPRPMQPTAVETA